MELDGDGAVVKLLCLVDSDTFCGEIPTACTIRGIVVGNVTIKELLFEAPDSESGIPIVVVLVRNFFCLVCLSQLSLACRLALEQAVSVLSRCNRCGRCHFYRIDHFREIAL